MSHQSTCGRVLATITSAPWHRKALAIFATLFLVALLMPTTAVHAETSPPTTMVRADNTFYAYVGAGETLDVSFMQAAPVGFTQSTITVNRPGAAAESCVITVAAPLGFECAWTGETAATAGIWSVTYDALGVQGRYTTWDITVRQAGTEVPGRVWSEAYVMGQRGVGDALFGTDFTLYYQAITGDQYRATYLGFNGIDSVFQANAIGLRMAPSCESYYQSSQGNGPFADGYSSAGAGCGPAYKIFFDEPAADLPASAVRFDGETDWILNPVVDPDVTDITFAPSSGTTQAGVITFNVANFVGNMAIQIDANGNGTYTDPEDLTIPYASASGAATYTFDGLDGLGNAIPADQPINIRAGIDRTGEIHFLNGDVELREGGIEVVSTRGPDAGNATLYWDDTIVNTQQADRCSGPLDAVSALGGVDSTGGVHGWDDCATSTLSNANNGINGSYGDTRTIQEWTYRAVTVEDVVAVAARASEIVVTKSADPASTTTVAAGQNVTYTISFSNTGDADGVVDYDDVISGVLDDATITATPTTSDAALIASTVTDGRFAVDGTLTAGQTVTVSYSVTVNPDGERGDNILGNFVVPGGTVPPTECVEGSTLCTVHPVAEIVVVKSADPASGTDVVPGDAITYTLTFQNIGEGAGVVDYDDVISGVLDDATLTSAPAASDAALVASDVVDGRFSIDGTLAGGQTVTVTYTVTVNPNGERGDNILDNYVVLGGEVPPTECVEGSALCTTHEVTEITVVKSADPASGTDVIPGQAITYTLTFSNVGAAEGDVDYDDVISGVLDDAAVTAAPTASDAALVASAIDDGRFTVDGMLAAGQTVTVSYTVTVNADGERGDNALGNFVVTSGEEPPTECVESSTLCTEHFVPEIVVTKSADPVSGSQLIAGQDVSYTLTFENAGRADGVVDWDDVISGVLDDATITAAPTSSNAALAVSDVVDGRFTVDGALTAGQVVTVTYTVTVNPDGERGDNVLSNFVVGGGEVPPTECVADSTLCTEHTVPNVIVTKSADPATGTKVVAGDVISYTLTFENVGAGNGVVDWDDVISGVLDDATLSAAPTSSNPALTVSAVTNGRFTVDGTLAAAQVVTVTYSVTVNPDGQRGDNVLGNFVVHGGEEPQAECVTGSVLCTSHPASPVFTPPPGLSSTGANIVGGLGIAALLAAVGAGAVVIARRRSQMTAK